MPFGCVYALHEAGSEEYRYIGKTSQPLAQRLAQHLRASSRKVHSHKNHWLNGAGRVVAALLYEAIDASDLNNAEIRLIAYYTEKEHRLTNATPGGDGQPKGYQHTAAARRKIAEALRGRQRTFSDSHLRHIRDVGLRRRGTPAGPSTSEWCTNISKAKTGVRRSDSARLSISRGHGGKPFLDQYGNRYETIQRAARTLNISAAAIWRVLHGITSATKQGHRFQWLSE